MEHSCKQLIPEVFSPVFLLDLPLEHTSDTNARRAGVTLIQIAAYMWPFQLAWPL